jgi:hypothetical protein
MASLSSRIIWHVVNATAEDKRNGTPVKAFAAEFVRSPDCYDGLLPTF